ncbi:MAG: hypothetical protein PHQ23_12910 [Candidatus Wallbacteria bacterium]|nr:hypothetical protein [Candidatus Wallbacteria bacterium]
MNLKSKLYPDSDKAGFMLIVAVLLFFLIVSGCSTPIPVQPVVTAYSGEVLITTCRSVENGFPVSPAREFTVNDIVYTTATWLGLSGDHVTTAIFIDPKGTVRFPTEVPLKNATGSATTWYWLKISEDNPGWAHGKWEVRVFIDGMLAGTREILID